MIGLFFVVFYVAPVLGDRQIFNFKRVRFLDDGASILLEQPGNAVFLFLHQLDVLRFSNLVLLAWVIGEGIGRGI